MYLPAAVKEKIVLQALHSFKTGNKHQRDPKTKDDY
jgi:hypothetical protein